MGTHARVNLPLATVVCKRTIVVRARELRAHGRTVHPRLAPMVWRGLVGDEQLAPVGHAGRPPTPYRAVCHAGVTAVPPCLLDFVGRIVLDNLVEASDEKRVSQRRKREGAEIGRTRVRNLASSMSVDYWSSESFGQQVLRGLFGEMGLVGEACALGSEVIAYRAFRCPCLGREKRMPNQVCDFLDFGFQDGTNPALGGVPISRLARAGPRNPCCEYRTQWTSTGALAWRNEDLSQIATEEMMRLGRCR